MKIVLLSHLANGGSAPSRHQMRPNPAPAGTLTPVGQGRAPKLARYTA